VVEGGEEEKKRQTREWSTADCRGLANGRNVKEENVNRTGEGLHITSTACAGAPLTRAKNVKKKKKHGGVRRTLRERS